VETLHVGAGRHSRCDGRARIQTHLIVNGHGGNTPAQGFVGEWIADHPEVRIKFHNWWNAPKVWAQVQAIDPVASHASWMENFPWTRLAKVEVPSRQKAMSDLEKLRRLDPKSVRRTSQRRQLRRAVPARRRRNDEDLADRRGRDARVADGIVGLNSSVDRLLLKTMTLDSPGRSYPAAKPQCSQRVEEHAFHLCSAENTT
jgi:creatinine amidohydrolase/Fe(II)-dependent formamide hydrolase-like protein